MKSFKIFPFVLLFTAASFVSMAQDLKTDSIAVAGNCGMCKSTIEKAARSAGVTDASWDQDRKMLTVRYNATATNTTKIQEKVAAAGYDTRDIKTTEAAYQKLHACCQYDRAEKGEKGDKGPKDIVDAGSSSDVKTKSCCAKEEAGHHAAGTEKAKSCCAKDAVAAGTASTGKAKDCCAKN